MNDLGALVLVVSQFTLYANVRKGRRLSWNQAARGVEIATRVFDARILIDMEAAEPVIILVEA